MKIIAFFVFFSFSILAFSQNQEVNKDLIQKEKKMSPRDSMDALIDKKIEESTKRTEQVEWKVFSFYVRIISKFSETKYDVNLNDRRYKNKYKDDFEIAKDFFKRYVEKYDDSNYNKTKAYRMLAWIEIEENDYNEAISYLKESERVVELNRVDEHPSEKAKLKKMYQICKIGLAKKEKS